MTSSHRLSPGMRSFSQTGLTAMSASATGETITYTITDEAPALATYALLPVIRRFADTVGVDVQTKDISVAARILAQFDIVPDHLTELGEMCKEPGANVIKLPNVSASLPQLTEAIAELQGQGFNIPDFPANPSTDAERDAAERYAKVLGSAVNPVLREGNSDRRVAAPVKAYAQKNPHRMGAWSSDSRSHVAHMSEGDFYGSEQSAVMGSATSVRIELVGADGAAQVMKPETALEAGEVIDSSFMNVAKLKEYLETEISDAKDTGIMLSLHLKATMMKISDPIIFGHVVKIFYKDVFEKHAETFEKIGVNPNNGVGDVYDKVSSLDAGLRAEIEVDLEAVYGNTRPNIAYVNSHKGITNLHVPSDVIIDASMPVVIRDSGKMWNINDELEDTKALIPDRSYARMYQTVIDDCKAHGQFDVSTMGNIPNVGLMAQKAEEYGSHDKTFEIPSAGTMRVVDNNSGEVYMEHSVSEGDIWRMCQTKDAPIRDWVKLAVSRARATGSPAIFWLDSNRAHDANLIAKVNEYLKDHDTEGLELSIAAPAEACKTSITRARAGNDTISVTGNVLRDYNTDLFPILELGTSAKMLSIVPLLAGGGLFETGAGGSAPKHVEQFVEEGHLRWDSLGEYLALSVAFDDLGEKANNDKARLLGKTLEQGIAKFLDERKSPSRKAMEIDNRGSTYYLAQYWAEAMAAEDDRFKDLAQQLKDNEEKIMDELINCQGSPVDIGGYYRPDEAKCTAAMCPSETLNSILGM
mgnify:CR=1 FL=1